MVSSNRRLKISTLKPWHEVVVPQADIRKGQFDESVFAADLSDVRADRGPLEYRDAETFFKKTYPTQGLVNLLGSILSRLAGKGAGEPVIQIQTPFGGGKTHSLIALYHLFCSPAETVSSPLGADVLKQAGVPAIPEAGVAAFVGTTAIRSRARRPGVILPTNSAATSWCRSTTSDTARRERRCSTRCWAADPYYC